VLPHVQHQPFLQLLPLQQTNSPALQATHCTALLSPLLQLLLHAPG
jgi:hypothetical protein